MLVLPFPQYDVEYVTKLLAAFNSESHPRMLFFNYHFYVNKSSMVSCTCAIAEWAVGRIPNVVIKVGKMP